MYAFPHMYCTCTYMCARVYECTYVHVWSLIPRVSSLVQNTTILYSLSPPTQSVSSSDPHSHASFSRTELDLTKEQLAHQHARVLSLQQRGAGEEEVCQERLAEQQLRLKQVRVGHVGGGVCVCVCVCVCTVCRGERRV